MDRRDFLHGYLWSLLSMVVSRALLPIFGILIARILGPGPYGLYAILLTIVAVFEVFRDAGLSLTYIADEKMDERRAGAYAAVAIGTGVIMATALWALSPWLAVGFGFRDEPLALPLAAGVILANAFTTIPVSALLKQARFREHSLSEIVPSFISYLVAFGLVLAGWRFEAMLAQMAVRTLLVLIIVNVYAPFPRPSFAAATVWEVVRRSNSLFVANILWTGYNLGDQLIVGRFLSNESAGFLGVAKNLAIRPLDFVTMPLNRTMYVAGSQRASDREHVAKYLYGALATSLLIVIPLYSGFALYANPIITVLYGDRFGGAIVPFALFSGFCALRSLGMLAASTLTLLGKARWVAVGWVGAYAVAGQGIWRDFAVLSVDRVVLWVLMGGLVVYVGCLLGVVAIVPPRSEDRRKIGRSALALLGGLAVLMAWRFMPIGTAWQLLAALLTGPPALLVLAGWLLKGEPRRYLSRAGLRGMWRDL